LVNLEFLIIHKLNLPFFERYKTSPDAWPWETDPQKWKIQLKRTIKGLFINNCVILPFFLLIDSLSGESKYRYDRESFPSILETGINICICMLIEDFVFYCSHRLMHSKYFYNKIHKIHHEYVEAVALCATYSHPIEFILGNLAPSAVSTAIMGSRIHFVTYLTYLVMIMHETHDGHSGYSFSWSPHRLMPMTFDADFHIFSSLEISRKLCKLFFNMG